MFLDDERVILNSTFYILNLLKGIYSYGDPPLPIPNREVKPVSADGTAPGWESRSMPNFQNRWNLFQRFLWRGSSAG